MQKKEMIQKLLWSWWSKKNEDGYVTKRDIQRAFHHQRYRGKITTDKVEKHSDLMEEVFTFLEKNWEVLPQRNRFVPALYRPKSWDRITRVLSKQELRKMKENEHEVRESFGLSKVMVGKILRNHYTRKQIMKKNPHFKEGYLPLGFYKKHRVRQIKVTGNGRGGMVTLFYGPDVDKYKQGKDETLSGEQRKQKKPELNKSSLTWTRADDNWINIHEAKEIATVSAAVLYRLGKTGQIQSKKIGGTRVFLKQSVELYEKNRNTNLSKPRGPKKRVQTNPYTYKKQGKDMYEQYKKLLEDGPFKKETKGDDVNHPDYYNDGKFEVIDVIEDWNLDFNAGNVIKYIARAKLKHTSKAEQKKDLKKALWYIQRMLNNL